MFLFRSALGLVPILMSQPFAPDELFHCEGSEVIDNGWSISLMYSTAVPLEEFDANLLLKRLDLERKSRLAEMNQLCSTTEVQSIGDGEKGFDVAELHLTILFANQITGHKTFNFTNNIARRVIGTSR